MANISILVSTQHGSTITVEPPVPGADCCLYVTIRTNLEPVGDLAIPYDRTALSIHGTRGDLAVLVLAMLDALFVGTTGEQFKAPTVDAENDAMVAAISGRLADLTGQNSAVA